MTTPSRDDAIGLHANDENTFGHASMGDGGALGLLARAAVGPSPVHTPASFVCHRPPASPSVHFTCPVIRQIRVASCTTITMVRCC